MKRVCIDPRYTKETVVYREPSASRRFNESFLEEEEEIKEILSNTEPLHMTESEKVAFANSTHCSICEEAFEESGSNKVIDHCHVTGSYRGAACNVCNLQFRICKLIPVIFHGLRNFYSHIIGQAIGEYEMNKRGIKCIPQNMEHYISFSLGDLRFLDSFQFLSSSLECLTYNLKATGNIMDFKHFCKRCMETATWYEQKTKGPKTALYPRRVLNYRNLKLYIQLGMEIKQIHTVLEFDQMAWLKSYIDFNTQKRMEAANEFEKTFYKILNCSVFGKLMECQRKHLDIILTNSERLVGWLFWV